MARSLVPLCCVLGLLAGCDRAPADRPGATPAGSRETPKTDVLEAGAALLQDNGPLAKHDVHLVGFHPMKADPAHQMTAHHYCRQVNQDFAQCVLFDSSDPMANLNGIEYIISEKLFAQLPTGEREFWHPHNAEILSGQLIAPGLPQVAEKALMRDKMNSYGKTWHTWGSRHGTGAGDRLPLGPALLAWSFNRDGEADPALVAERDRTLSVSSQDLRREREELRELARPQDGVDALKGQFARPTTDIPGVVDSRASLSSATDPASARTR